MKKKDKVKYISPVADIKEGVVACDPYICMDNEVVDVRWDDRKIKSESIPTKLLQVVQ